MSTIPIYALVDTWDNVGTTFKGISLDVTDTASASGSLLMDLQVGGSSKFSVSKGGKIAGGFTNINVEFANGSFYVRRTDTDTVQFSVSATSRNAQLAANGLFGWSNTNDNAAATADLTLYRDAANTLAQRNGVNAQAFRLYNTYTDASNYERGKFEWASNVLRIGTEKAGTGTARGLELQTDGVTRVTIGAGEVNVPSVLRIGPDTNKGIIRYTLNSLAFEPYSSGGMLFIVNVDGWINNIWTAGNPWTIGSIGNEQGNSNRAGSPIRIRPKGGAGNGNAAYVELYTGLSQVSGTAGHTAELAVKTFLPATGTPGLQFGGTTSSFPALKRSTTSLQARLADDSAFTNIQGKLTTETAYTAGAPTATGYIVLYDSTGTAYKIPAEAL